MGTHTTMIKRSLLRAANRSWIFVVVCALFGAAVYGPFMPYLDGFLAPVTSHIAFVDTETGAPMFDPSGKQLLPFKVDPDDPAGIVVKFASVKYRACDYKGTTARGASDGRYVKFALKPNQPSPGTRTPGKLVSDLWHLDAPSPAGLVIEFTHQCGIPFWTTITRVWP